MKRRNYHYEVTVRYEQERQIRVWARNEEAAKEKAQELVLNWNGVIDAEATGVRDLGD